MRLRLTTGQLIGGEWREPGHEFDAPAALAEQFLRAGAAVPADEGGAAPSSRPPGHAEKAADVGRDKADRATDPKRR